MLYVGYFLDNANNIFFFMYKQGVCLMAYTQDSITNTIKQYASREIQQDEVFLISNNYDLCLKWSGNALFVRTHNDAITRVYEKLNIELYKEIMNAREQLQQSGQPIRFQTKQRSGLVIA